LYSNLESRFNVASTEAYLDT